MRRPNAIPLPALARVVIAIGLSLALAACIFPPPLTSDAVSLPQDARAVEPALEGDFWLPNASEADASFEVTTISRDSRNRYHIVSHDQSGGVSWSTDDENGYMELIRTSHDGIHVVLAQVEGRTLYALAFRSRAGTWVLFPFIGGIDRPEGTLREQYLAGIAERHGLKLSYDDKANELKIAGRPDAPAIAALFSDPAFLAGLQLDPDDGTRLFPARLANLPPPEDRSAWWETGFSAQLSSEPFALTREQQILPRGFSGRFTDGGRPVDVRPQADGGIVLHYPPIKPTRDAWSVRLHLLPLDGTSTWLGISEPVPQKDAETSVPKVRFTYSIVRLAPNGDLTLTGICLSKPQFSAPLAALVEAKRAEVGMRYGISFDGARISGRLGPASLRALHADPQFQVGLAPDQGMACGRQEFQRRPGKAKR